MVISCVRQNEVSYSDYFPEIDPEVDFDARRAVYFRQMRYGLFVRQPPCTCYVSYLTFLDLDPNGVACERHGLTLHTSRLGMGRNVLSVHSEDIRVHANSCRT